MRLYSNTVDRVASSLVDLQARSTWHTAHIAHKALVYLVASQDKLHQ